MTVRIYPDAKGEKSNAILRFFRKYKITCELMRPEDMNVARTYRLGELAAVEVNGRLFVNPNDDALRKIVDMN
jgi:hypothetical protein